MDKTNAMRILDGKRAEYEALSYPASEAVSALEAARLLGIGPERIFKTLVTVGRTRDHYVFVVPATGELDLRKAARSVEMVRSKELLPLTGYVHGGCSPVGMKKAFRTVIDASAERLGTIVVSAGRIGLQMRIALDELRKALPFSLSELTEDRPPEGITPGPAHP